MFFHPLFQPLPDDVRRTLSQRSRMVTLKKGDVLAEAGQRCADVFLVSNGKVRVDSGDAGLPKATTGFLTAQDFFVEDVTADSYVLQSSLTAVLHSTVQLLPLPLLRNACLQHPQVLLAAIDLVNQRVQDLRKQLRRLTTQESEVVIGRALYELSDEGPNGRRILSRRITQTALASYVGMSREQVNKKMRELELKGLIRRVEEGYELDPAFAHTNVLAERTEASS